MHKFEVLSSPQKRIYQMSNVIRVYVGELDVFATLYIDVEFFNKCARRSLTVKTRRKVIKLCTARLPDKLANCVCMPPNQST